MNEEAYWCPRWYPAGPVEMPCDRFFTTGLYLLDVDAHDRELEPAWEGEPSEVACREHDASPDKISAVEWDVRLARARALAAARSWQVPRAEEWEDKDALGAVLGNWGGECGARVGHETCRWPARLLAVERGGRSYRKVVCADALARAILAKGDYRRSDLAQTTHLNLCLPYLPPNY